jgi:hypothetical protein
MLEPALPAVKWSGDGGGDIGALEWVLYDVALLNDTDTPMDYTGATVEGVASAQWFIPPVNASKEVTVDVYSLSEKPTIPDGFAYPIDPMSSTVVGKYQAKFTVTNNYDYDDPLTCTKHQEITQYVVDMATGLVSG